MANLVQLGMLEKLDGLLLVDKPEGIQFSTVVKTVKRKFGLPKVGHGGSLDAMASGLMVLLLNDANKFADRVMGADRAYSGALRLGETTDTGDACGRPAPPPAPPVAPADLRGDVFQTEPRFCAVRREGSAGYEVVDTGEHSQFLAHVYRFDLGETGADGLAPFELVASKGVIVRALALDLGATLVSLRRVRVGRLEVKDAIPFAKLLEMEMKDFPSCVMPVAQALR